MDFTFTEAQQELSALARRILTDRVTVQRLRGLSEDRFDPALWRELATAGLLDADELGLLGQCSVLIEMGRSVAPVPYLSSIVVGASTLLRFGVNDVHAARAREAMTGELVITAALTADGKARAERSGHGWVVSGTFTTVPAGNYAGMFLVPVQDLVFLVRRGDDGLTVLRQELVDGDTEAQLELENVWVSGDRVLEGAAVVQWMTDRLTVGLCALQLGVVEKALEMTAEYATSRVQFGRPIATFQAVAQRLADAYIDVEAIRLTMWQAAWRLVEGLSCDTEIATAKFWAADGGHRVAHTTVHVHGGVGIDLEHPAHRYFVAAKHYEFALGHATDQLLLIGEALRRP